jgi:hypothetical protein
MFDHYVYLPWLESAPHKVMMIGFTQMTKRICTLADAVVLHLDIVDNSDRRNTIAQHIRVDARRAS